VGYAGLREVNGEVGRGLVRFVAEISPTHSSAVSGDRRAFDHLNVRRWRIAEWLLVDEFGDLCVHLISLRIATTAILAKLWHALRRERVLAPVEHRVARISVEHGREILEVPQHSAISEVFPRALARHVTAEREIAVLGQAQNIHWRFAGNIWGG
jgi:hypothetical protein